ncbi:gephyrin-like molybdotransferase Glp [Arsenicicoccus dermatophilus]|uniref:molybdopterin molybdotransferase MoeA n=1 Tax=Arsenicicoccus dermatophilus TaxID=1076331 RepID=UPI001F4CCDB8|nr:gephyrin-like molybdotransferase Glp [Arsenicicoccus dermatophilus]MCH8612089.1 molybdopterin molybdotransferase MoeA [Arsenicicoccus dermatophilus]
MASDLVPLEQHRAAVLAACGQVPRRVVTVPVLEAHGAVLAEDVVSAVDVPVCANSAMDGYAVRRADVLGASAERPVVLPVTDDVPAGRTDLVTLAPGTAIRIMTGAPVPEGADAVIPVELTDRRTDQVRLLAEPRPAAHVRPAGDDVRRGQVVLAAGTLVDARVLALLVSVGRPQVAVVAPPRVTVLTTGDELLEPGALPGHGEVVDSNGPMLVAALREHGFPAVRARAAGDDEAAFERTLTELVEGCDVLVTTGGVSAGAYDVVKAVLSRGGRATFRGVAMQPGKPQGFGTLEAADGRRVPVLTLPGNPVSAMVSYLVFVLPALRQLAAHPAGPDAADRDQVVAVADDAWRAPAGRTQLARVTLHRGDGGWRLRLAGGQGSHMLGALAAADALAVVPAAVEEVRPGMPLTCLLLHPLATHPTSSHPAPEQESRP